MKNFNRLPSLLFLLILISFQPLLAQGRNSNIVIEGADGKSAKTIREIVEGNLEDPFNMNQLQKVLGQIYNMGNFNDVEVYFDEKGEKTDVIFKVYPLRIIKKIQIFGNRTFSTFDLQNESGLSEGDGYSQEKVKNSVENVKKYYNLRGYLNVSVIGEFAHIEGSPDLIFKMTITEGSPCLIEDLVFKSVNGSLNRRLQSRFKDYKNKIFSQAVLGSIQNEINEELFKDKYYSTAVLTPETLYNAQKTGVTLNYVVNDPYAFAISYEIEHEPLSTGLDQSQIEGRLNLSATSRLSNSPIEDLMERVLRIYKKAGYANVTVKYHESLFTQDFERRVSFLISEGPRVRIKDIIFEGSFSRPAKYYKKLLLDYGGDLVSSKIYNSDDIDTGIQNLLTELQNQGFISVKVSGTRTDFDKNRNNAIVKVTLEEGPQTFVDKIVFKGIKNVSKSEIENSIKLNAGGALNLGTLEEAGNNIIGLYQSKGYLDAQVTNQGKAIISYSPDNTRATLTFEITEGPQVTVSSVVIEGNIFTKEYVIRRELKFRPGDVLTPDKIAFTEQKLQRLSLFSSVDIRTLEEDPTQGNRTVLVHVQERDPGVFKTGIGINNDLGLTIHLFTGAGYHNLWGTGRGVTGRAEISDKTVYNFVENSINLGYTEPFVFGTENTGRVNLNESQKIYSVSGSLVYAAQILQGDTVLERDLTQRLKLLYEVFGLATENTWELTSGPGTTPFNKIVIATTGPSFLYDRRDDPFNPTKGDIASLNLEYSNPVMGSDARVNYIKGEGGYTRYISFGRVIWANELKGGYIRDLSNDPLSLIPATKGFLLGGPSTIRGFGAQEAFPAITEYPNSSPYRGFGGQSYYVLTKTEIRFPIYGIMWGAVFYDGGKVGIDSFFGQNPVYRGLYDWKDSIGIGIRFLTPVGPTSFEWAWKLRPDPTRYFVGPESPGALVISIGVF